MADKNFCTIGGGWPSADGAGGDQPNSPRTLPGELSPTDFAEIRSAIRKKYALVASSASGKFSYPTGKNGAESLGYDPAAIEAAHPGFLKSFCGVGNPFTIGKIERGTKILDIGCGAGFDLFVACLLTGRSGQGYGVDLTDEMVSRAKENLSTSEITNFEIEKVDSEELPFSDNFFDTVISNGVINLSPCKQVLFREIFRVLKPGGKLQFADVVQEGAIPPHLLGSLEAWSQWIGGTIPVRDQIELMEKAGFEGVESPGTTGFRTSPHTIGALFRGGKPFRE